MQFRRKIHPPLVQNWRYLLGAISDKILIPESYDSEITEVEGGRRVKDGERREDSRSERRVAGGRVKRSAEREDGGRRETGDGRRRTSRSCRK